MYVKEEAGNGKFIITPLTEENVFSICPVCGEEHQVDLVDIVTEPDFDLTIKVCCPHCARKIKEEGLPAVMKWRESRLARELRRQGEAGGLPGLEQQFTKGPKG